MEANGGLFTFDVELLASGMRITEEEVRSYFTDGRRISFVLERRIAREILEGTIAKSEGDAWDVVDAQGDFWEVRSLTKKVYFCPSYMVGKGRKFDEKGFLEKLSKIRGYVISDVTLFPNIPVWLVEAHEVLEWYQSGKLGAGTHTSRAKVLKLMTASLGDQEL
jgi:hypothetical protein